ncbi:MAG: hypothetical protein AAGA54_04725 [Myxococcota bacterium]
MKNLAATLTLACATAGLLAGCDVEPGSALEYDTVARIDLGAMKASPWGKEMLGSSAIDVDIDGSDACADLVNAAETVTVGTGQGRVEVYVQGPIDADAADDCLAVIEKDLADDPVEKGETPKSIRGESIGKKTFAFVVGSEPLPAPSKARLKDLTDADPSPHGEPMWFVARPAGKSDIQYAEAWMSPKKGLDGHLSIEFADEAKAAKIGAEATMALTMLKMSDEAGDFAKAIDLDLSGATMSADVHASTKTMKAVLKNSGKPHEKPSPEEIEAMHKRARKDGHSISFSIGTSEK